MHCEVAEAHSDKRPKEALGAPAPGRGPTGLSGTHMAFRVTVSGGGCVDGGQRDVLPRPPVPPPCAHELLRPRSPRDYGPSKATAAGKGKSGPANVPGRRCGGIQAAWPGHRTPLWEFSGELGGTFFRVHQFLSSCLGLGCRYKTMPVQEAPNLNSINLFWRSMCIESPDYMILLQCISEKKLCETYKNLIN